MAHSGPIVLMRLVVLLLATQLTKPFAICKMPFERTLNYRSVNRFGWCHRLRET